MGSSTTTSALLPPLLAATAAASARLLPEQGNHRTMPMLQAQKLMTLADKIEALKHLHVADTSCNAILAATTKGRRAAQGQYSQPANHLLLQTW
jgi:hypothetical protein